MPVTTLERFLPVSLLPLLHATYGCTDVPLLKPAPDVMTQRSLRMQRSNSRHATLPPRCCDLLDGAVRFPILKDDLELRQLRAAWFEQRFEGTRKGQVISNQISALTYRPLFFRGKQA